MNERHGMGHSALTIPLTQVDLARLDRLLAEITCFHDPQTDLLVEHLQSARIYLLGAMPDEYEFGLIAAKNSAAELSNISLKKAVVQEVGFLLDHLTAAQPRATDAPPRPRDSMNTVEEGDTKSELYRFFHGSSTKLGVFYPTHYIFASFP